MNLVVGGKVLWYVNCSQVKEATEEQCRKHAHELAQRLNTMYGYVVE